MKKIILQFLQINPVTQPEVDMEHTLRVATATLLVEVVRADFVVQQAELLKLRAVLKQQFALSDEELVALMEQAQQGADRLVSIQHITRLLNQHYDHQMKVRVVELMWQLIYADWEKDHYEEHLIRQVAELLYVSHEEFIRARHKAEPNA